MRRGSNGDLESCTAGNHLSEGLSVGPENSSPFVISSPDTLALHVIEVRVSHRQEVVRH